MLKVELGNLFVTALILTKIRKERRIALALASIEMTTLHCGERGGSTAHAALKLPLDIDTKENPVCISSQTYRMAEGISQCHLIAFDECFII